MLPNYISDTFGTKRVLPIWNDNMSDQCSVPSWLRWLFPKETESQCDVCVKHDEAYYYGGSKKDKKKADEELLIGLINKKMSIYKTYCYWIGVRVGGIPIFRIKNVSWSFGGEFFKYSDKPAIGMALH